MMLSSFGLRRFMELGRPDMVAFVTSIILLAVSSLFEGLSVGLVIPVVDILTKGGDFSGTAQLPLVGMLASFLPSSRLRYFLFALLGAILALIILKNVLVYISELLVSKLSRACEHTLRTKVYRRYLSFGKKYFDRNKIGGLSDLAISQVYTACGYFRDLHNLLLYVFLVVAYFTMMALISWKLTLISLVLLPWVYFLIRAISHSILRSSRERFEIDQAINARLFDTLANMTLIRSYTNEEREAGVYEALSNRSRVNLYGIWKKILLAPYLQEIVLNIVIVGLVSVCFFVFLKTKAMPVALFLSFFIMLRRFAGNLSQAGATYTEFCKTFVPIQQVVTVFDDTDKEFIHSGRTPYGGLKSSIEFDRVCFGYRQAQVLNDLSLSFQKGKMTAIVGPTGAGKTTIAHLIPRFYDPTGGQIRVDGAPIESFDLRSLRRRIAVVDQDVSIFNASIRENILYGMDEAISDAKLDEVTKKAFLYDLVMSLPARYDTMVGDRGVRLSGGERQRVAIARALLKDPDIFVFDEATSSLDVETERQIQKAVENVTRGRTVIAIAHRLSTIKNADHVIVIEKGAVVEEGSFDSLLKKKGKFHYYWSLHWTEPEED